MKTLIRTLYIFVTLISIIPQAQSGEIDVDTVSVVQSFRDEVESEVSDLLTDGSNTVNQMRSIVNRVLFFALLVFAVVSFIFFGPNPTAFNALLMGFLYGFLNETYLIWTDGMFAFFEQAALGIQDQVVGTKDTFFLSKYWDHLMNRVGFEELDMFDGMVAIVNMAFLWVASLVFMILIRISEIWAVWGFLFCQLIGPLFLPFIIHPTTRGLFDKWLALMLGFCIYAFMARCIGTLFAIFTKSLLGETTFSTTLSSPVEISASSPEFSSFVLHIVIGIFMLLSAGKMSSALAGGVGGSGGTNSMMKAGGRAGRAGMQKLAKIIL